MFFFFLLDLGHGIFRRIALLFFFFQNQLLLGALLTYLLTVETTYCWYW